MATYIEREAVLERLKYKRRANDFSNYAGLESAISQVAKAPAADVVPVVHGRWIEHEIPDEPLYGTDYECSVCGKFHHDNWNYCPICGARMDGE